MPSRRRSWLVVIVVMALAGEARVSGGFRECYTDLGGVLCVESDVRKIFRDAEQAEEWLAWRRGAAEHRLQTVIPALRAALATARADGLPLAAVDDWRLPPSAPEEPGAARRERLDLGEVERDLHSLIVTTTRALGAGERAALVARLRRAIETAPPPPAPAAIDADSAGGDGPVSPLPRPVAPGTVMPATPHAIEDVRGWQPLFLSDHDGVPLGIGTTARVSPLARERWRPWLRARLTALRAAFTGAAAGCALPAPVAAGPLHSGFSDVDGFRPWGPLLLGPDVQARVDDGDLVRMARLRAESPQAAEALYGPLTACLRAATTAAPLPAPPGH